VKHVLHALEEVRNVLLELGHQNLLDEKLAEYAFFPLSHVFNESKRLSSRCLEVAAECVSTLVDRGWREKLLPEMGKQLLILMSLLAGGDPRNTDEAPSDELRVVAFNCIGILVYRMRRPDTRTSILDDLSTKSIVDQLVFLLLESITENRDDNVQTAAAEALLALHEGIDNKVLLASLLPRTVSSLTKVLRPSTKARRTQKVLTTYLQVLRASIRAVLADDVVSSMNDSTENATVNTVVSNVLDASWLRATAPQIKMALTHVSQLKNNDGTGVRRALLRLCLMVIEECPNSLAESIPLMVETIVSISSRHDELAQNAFAELRTLLTVNEHISSIVKSKFHDWSIALPRIMQMSDDRPKRNMLAYLSTSFQVLSDTMQLAEGASDMLASTLLNSVSGAVESTTSKSEPITDIANAMSQHMLIVEQTLPTTAFEPVLLNHPSQRDLAEQLQLFVADLRRHSASNLVARSLVNRIPESKDSRLVSAIWLSLNLLLDLHDDLFDLDSVIDMEVSGTDLSLSRPLLVSDLYAFTVNYVVDYEISSDWRPAALALQCLVLQANQLGKGYRPELIDTLYPVLALFGSQTEALRTHAMTALNSLASACEYTSATEMLVDNVDYLINSVAMKLNSFDLSPQAPQVLLMMIRLCGARLIPFLDDLIGSIFAALDTFHGYTRLVEVLFEVLRAMVDESTKTPTVAITDGKEMRDHRKQTRASSDLDDVLGDLENRLSRKRKLELEDEEPPAAPRRPWSSKLDALDKNPESGEEEQPELGTEEENEGEEPLSPTTKEQPLTRSHQLLLSIAQSTIPHLASPSSRVRHILLQLIEQISPLLSRDENSFLPLINAIWPAVLSRLFSDLGDDGEGETSYNICAAAKAICKLCEGAGDFMSTRIEDMFMQLEKLFKKTYGLVHGGGEKKSLNSKQGGKPSTTIVGAVNLDVVGMESNAPAASNAVTNAPSRTTNAQILNALIDLLTCILGHVRLTEDNADKILEMLAPVLRQPGHEGVKEALTVWNADALWLAQQQMRMEREILENTRSVYDRVWHDTHTPALSRGSDLQEIVF